MYSKIFFSDHIYQEIIRDYYMTFSILALVSTCDSHIKPECKAGGLIWVQGWYLGRYGKFHVIIYLSHILHLLFTSNDFYFADKIFELTNCENKSLRDLPLFKFLFFESGFKKISNNVNLYNDIRKCKIYPRRWHLNGNSYSTRHIHLSQLGW